MSMSKKEEKAFVNALESRQAKYRSRLPEAVAAGSLSKRQLRVLAEQVYLQEKWPSHIANVYLGFDDAAMADRELITFVIDIIKAENLGEGSKGIAHSDLARRFAAFLGVSNQRLKRVQPTPENRAVMDWCDMSALERPWKEALAVQLACESQFDLMDKIAKGLKRKYDARNYDIGYWTVHASELERSHSREGTTLLADHISPAESEGVLYAFEQACRLICEFYDSVLEV